MAGAAPVHPHRPAAQLAPWHQPGSGLTDLTPVRSSHERIDGTGYPDGLVGDEIPIGSRIIAICDAFDAMISDRTYRAAIPVADALSELRRHAGTQFDSRFVDIFDSFATTLADEGHVRAA